MLLQKKENWDRWLKLLIMWKEAVTSCTHPEVSESDYSKPLMDFPYPFPFPILNPTHPENIYVIYIYHNQYFYKIQSNKIRASFLNNENGNLPLCMFLPAMAIRLIFLFRAAQSRTCNFFAFVQYCKKRPIKNSFPKRKKQENETKTLCQQSQPPCTHMYVCM